MQDTKKAGIRYKRLRTVLGRMYCMDQHSMTKRNRIAWTADSYQAWVSRYGTPDQAAADIISDPRHTLRRILEHVGELQGLAVANPLGSHGRIATALALLRAKVTVFDVSENNARYARELAASANVQIEYLVGDFLETAQECESSFDAAVMELGVVHYFADIVEFAAAVRELLKPGGKLVLNEFHPLLKKSVSLDSGQPMLEGDYFRTDTEEAPTPYEIFTTTDIPKSLIRRWNLGEIVTGFASSEFKIDKLIEHPSLEHSHLPGTFTLVATAI